MKEEKISSRQATALFSGFFLGTAIVMNPATQSGADACFSTLVAIAAGLIISGMTVALAVLHPGKSLVEIFVFCFGKTAGRIVGFFYLLFSMWLSSAVLLTFSSYSVIVSYPETPILFISICYMLLIAFVVKLGLEVMGRISEVFIVFVVIILAVTFLSLFSDFHPDAFLPMFKDGIAKPATDGLKGAPLPFSEIFLSLNILPNLNNRKKTSHVVWISVLLAGGIMILFTIRNISVLGVDAAAQSVFPSEKVSKLMPGISVVPLLDIVVIMTGVLKVSVALYSSAKILGDIFFLKDFKIFVLPIAALDIVGSVFSCKDIFTLLLLASKVVPAGYVPILIVMPLVMLIISLVKSGKPASTPSIRE